MRTLAKAGAITPQIRLLAINLCSRLRPQDFRGEAVLLHNFVRDEIRYIRDVQGVETVQTPEATLEIGAGDCDDKATLCASLFNSIGIKARFCVLNRSGSLCHVWTQALIGGKWENSETTINLDFGESPPLKNGDKVFYYDC